VSNWWDAYVGIPYDKDNFDCADFVVMVQREVFGRDIELPQSRPRGTRGQRQIGQLSRAYAEKTDRPVAGDLVLMFDGGSKYPCHAGVYFEADHSAWVLHNSDNPGHSFNCRVQDLPFFGARIEGFYTWK
jgi:NlpC/P60 family